jgi:transposase
MALSAKLKVPLPSNGIIIRRSGRYHYVYKVIKSYRNNKGQSTNERISIGKLDEKSGLLLPNNNYWLHYEQDAIELLPSFDSIRSLGATFLITTILRSLQVEHILKSTLGPERAAQVLTVATYMVCGGNIMEHILDWCETYTLHETAMSDRQASALFASITHDERMAFFTSWAREHPKDRYLAYDVTSFSSYAKGIEDTEWGYNRDGDKLPQINLGCFMGYESALPLFYVTYPGSIVDKSHMSYMMAYNDDLGIDGATFVMDKGFASTANIRYMHSKQLPYILGVAVRHKATRDAIDKVRDTVLSMKQRIGQGVYAGQVHGFFYGEASNMHIYYDPGLAEAHRADLYRAVEVQEERLRQLEQLTKREAKRYGAFFDIDLAKDGSFTFECSYQRIDEAARNAGFFCLLTSTGLKSAEVLVIYRRKDVIEKGFDDLKNHIDMKRLRTHNTHTTDGKLFCAFIALIVTSYINAKLGAFMKDNSMSKDSVIAELEKIKSVIVSADRQLMNPITRAQRSILEAFELSENKVKSYITPAH